MPEYSLPAVTATPPAAAPAEHDGDPGLGQRRGGLVDRPPTRVSSNSASCALGDGEAEPEPARLAVAEREEIITEGPAALTVGPGGRQPFALPTRGGGTVKLATTASGGTLSVFELVIESGEGPGLHVHSREHELWYVLEGEFRFLLGDALVHQPTGGLAFWPPRCTPHLPEHRPGIRAAAGPHRAVRAGGVLPRVRPASDRSLRRRCP